MPDPTPHHGVHRPLSFVCNLDDPDDTVITYAERPAPGIAAALLEEVGEWHRAVEGLRGTPIPPQVTAALHTLHEAVAAWTDLNAARRRAR